MVPPEGVLVFPALPLVVTRPGVVPVSGGSVGACAQDSDAQSKIIKEQNRTCRRLIVFIQAPLRKQGVLFSEDRRRRQGSQGRLAFVVVSEFHQGIFRVSSDPNKRFNGSVVLVVVPQVVSGVHEVQPGESLCGGQVLAFWIGVPQIAL